MGYFIEADADCASERALEPHTRLRQLSGHGHRYYIPVIGRWAGRDPVGEGGGLNLEGALANDPVNAIDPDGQLIVLPPSDLMPHPPYPTPVPVPGVEYKWVDGSIMYELPPWWYHPPDEGKPCCGAPAKLEFFEKHDAGTTAKWIRMKEQHKISGQYKDDRVVWWTCHRADKIAGYDPGLWDKSQVEVPVNPFFGGPLITHVRLRWLSCENEVWTLKEEGRSSLYTWSWSKLSYVSGPVSSYIPAPPE